jgi:hypothetical protein
MTLVAGGEGRGHGTEGRQMSIGERIERARSDLFDQRNLLDAAAKKLKDDRALHGPLSISSLHYEGELRKYAEKANILEKLSLGHTAAIAAFEHIKRLRSP